MSKVKVGDKVRVTKDDVTRLIGLTGTLIRDDSGTEGDAYPYKVEFDDVNAAQYNAEWVTDVEPIEPDTIDKQELADFVNERYRLDLIDAHSIAVLREKFNLPEPVRRKKTMTVTLTIDVTDRDGEFTEIGDTYGAFVSLMYEVGGSTFGKSPIIEALEKATDENISVVIREETE